MTPSLPDADPEPLPDFVYSLHGIRTNARWQKVLSAEISAQTNFETGYRNYERFDLRRFVFKNVFAYAPLRLFEQDLRDYQRRYRVSVIAHSFGTWLVLKALKENKDLKIHNLILCGSIFPRAHAWWRQLKNDTGQITGQIVNFCGVRDPFPALAYFLSRDYGPSGVTGAGDPTITDSFHDCGHSGFLTREFCRDYFVKILLGKKLDNHEDAAETPRYINTILWAAAHRAALAIAALVIGWIGSWAYSSEISCHVRTCSFDVVRIHDYTSSTRVEGSRRYVDRVIFEYTLNYDAETIPFRAPKDRDPKVVSFVGDRLKPLDPDVSNVRARTSDQTADQAAQRKWREFSIPVRHRRAFFSVEFSNDKDEGPDGVSIVSDKAINSLRVSIITPEDVSLVAPDGMDFNELLLMNREPVSPEVRGKCKFDGSGKGFACGSMPLPARSELFYCFQTKNWNHRGEIGPQTTAACPKKL